MLNDAYFNLGGGRWEGRVKIFLWKILQELLFMLEKSFQWKKSPQVLVNRFSVELVHTCLYTFLISLRSIYSSKKFSELKSITKPEILANWFLGANPS